MTLVHAHEGEDVGGGRNLDRRPDSPQADGAPKAPQNVTVELAGEGFVWITLRPGAVITAAHGAPARERFLSLTGGKGAGVLLIITGVESVTRDAVKFFSDATTVTAFAIVGSTSVDRVIAHGRRGLGDPDCPSRYFSDEQEALTWLRGSNKLP
jgi:hypothetical protein